MCMEASNFGWKANIGDIAPQIEQELDHEAVKHATVL